MKVTLVAAMDQDFGIGYRGAMPWPRLPADLRRFAGITHGENVVCGRATYDSIPWSARYNCKLPGRRVHVLTRTPYLEKHPRGTVSCAGIQEAVSHVKRNGGQRLIVIGGQDVYIQFMEYADTIELTVVQGHHPADRFFPHIGPGWSSTWENTIKATADTPEYRFFTLTRPAHLTTALT